MTSKEKAKELVEKYSIKVIIKTKLDSIPTLMCDDLQKESAKQCALIAVDEIISVIKPIMLTGEKLDYWQQVKEEIETIS